MYWDSSCSFFQSWVLYAFTFCTAAAGRETSRDASCAACVMVFASVAVLPMRVILVLVRVERRGVVVKGGFRRPSLGIRYFWLLGGTERVVAMCVERSVIVADGGKVRVCVFPWWVREREMSSAVVDVGPSLVVDIFISSSMVDIVVLFCIDIWCSISVPVSSYEEGLEYESVVLFGIHIIIEL